MTEWLHRAGFQATLLGNHFSARAQEYLFGEACRVSLIEVTCVRLAIHMGQEATGDVAPEAEQAAQQPTGTLWEQVDSFSLEDVFLRRVPMLKTCPHSMGGRLWECFPMALTERHRATMESDELVEIRAWELFALVPTLLLQRPRMTGAVGRSELSHRAEEFARGHWRALIEAALRDSPAQSRGRPERREAEERERRGKAAQARVQRGQVSRARQELTGAALAPKNEATLQELRARRPQEQVQPIPQKVLDFMPIAEVNLNAKLFTTCLREAPSGSSPGPGVCTNEMLKVCLDNTEHCARSPVPDCIFKEFTMATMTALQKPDGGIRGIATSTSFRRLVAKTLAKQFMSDVEKACAPFQFALSTRAGTAWGTPCEL